jgi:hypothetical protein
MGDPQITMGFNTEMAIHDLDDLGYFSWIGSLHIYPKFHMDFYPNFHMDFWKNHEKPGLDEECRSDLLWVPKKG